MNTQKIIDYTPSPRTRISLADDLRKLGLSEGMMVIVHSSLSSLGWVNGGSVTVIQALMDVITPSGTIVMPTQTTDYSDPSKWMHPPVPKEWWPIIKDTMPAYEPDITPTVGMGKIVETFRQWPGTLRSSHPAVSFAAWGKYAKQITNNHLLDYGLGEGSPLAEIYKLDGWVLMLGVSYDSNTSFHLAEYRANSGKPFEAGAPILEDGKRIWKAYKDIELDEEKFPEIGAEFEKENMVQKGFVGSAESRLFKQRVAVDFAEKWLKKRK